jgi:hypothetical protein
MGKLFSKIVLAAGVAMVGLTAVSAAEASPFHRRHGYGWGPVAAMGVLGLAAAGAYRAAQADDYVDCRYVERVNRWGDVVVRRVCY